MIDYANWTARHEAAHAAVAHYLGIRVCCITIDPAEAKRLGACEGARGMCKVEEREADTLTDEGIDERVVLDLVGFVFDWSHAPRTASLYERLRAWQTARKWSNDDGAACTARVERLEPLAREVLSRPDVLAAIERVAAVLLEKKSLTGDEFRELVRDLFAERS